QVQVIVPGAARKLREQRGLSSEYLVRAHQKSPGATQARNFDPPTKGNLKYSTTAISLVNNFNIFSDVILGPQRLTEEGTSLLCKSAPDICASNPQAISYVDKADLSHMLPAYPDTQNLVDPRFTFVDKADPSIVDSRLSGFADKEGLMDSRILPDSRQNMIAFNDSKEHVISQETRYGIISNLFAVIYNHTSSDENKKKFLFSISNSYESQKLIYILKRMKEILSRVYLYEKMGYNTKSECLLDAPLGFNRYNSMAGQTVPITLKHQNSPTVSAIQAQAMYQNFGTIHSGILRVSEPGTSSSSNSSQRSMTLQNPKRKSQIAQNTFSTLECEKRKPRAAGIAGKVNFYTGS
ncbi:GSCOCG00012741001-RA-CDS, partial [Cotesia congregata]